MIPLTSLQALNMQQHKDTRSMFAVDVSGVITV